MAEADSTETSTHAPLKPFQWHSEDLEGLPGIDFAGRALDIASGINCVLEILQRNGMEKEYGTAVLNGNQEGRLMGLVIAASDTLARESEQYMEWARRYGADACGAFSARRGKTT